MKHYGKKSPCYKCPDRWMHEESGKFTTCRTDCPRWAEYQAERRAVCMMQQKEREQKNVIYQRRFSHATKKRPQPQEWNMRGIY